MAYTTEATIKIKAEDLASNKIEDVKKSLAGVEKAAKSQGTATTNSAKKQASAFEKTYEAARKYFYIFETGRRIAQTINQFIVEPLQKANQQAIDFGKALAEVSTLYGKDIVDPGGEERMAKLVNSVKDFSFQFGKMPVDQAKALYFAISAGALKAADATELLRVTNMLATAGMVDAETATRSLTTVINAFVPQMEDAENKFKAAERISDLYFITVQKGVTTIGELAPKIGRVASSAATANMSMETMFALIAAGTKAIGRTPYTITGMAAAIKNVLSPTAKSKKVFKELGLEFGIAATSGDQFAKLMETIGKRYMKPVGDAARITAADIDRLFPRARASRFVMALIGNGAEDLMNTLRVMQNQEQSAGATREAYAKITATAAFQQERLAVAFNLLGIEFGEIGTKSGITAAAYKGMSTALMQTAIGLRLVSKESKNAGDNVEDMARIATAAGVILLGIPTLIVSAFASLGNAAFSLTKMAALGFNALTVKMASGITQVMVKMRTAFTDELTSLARSAVDTIETLRGNTVLIEFDEAGEQTERFEKKVSSTSQLILDAIDDLNKQKATGPFILDATISNEIAEIDKLSEEWQETIKGFAEFEDKGFGVGNMLRKFMSVLKQLGGNVQNFNGDLDDMAMDEYIQKIKELMNSVGDTGDKFKLASEKASQYLDVLSKIAATPLATSLIDRGGATRIGSVSDQLSGTADIAREVGMESGFSKLVEEAAKQAGSIKFEGIDVPNVDGASESVRRLMSLMSKLSKGVRDVNAVSGKFGALFGVGAVTAEKKLKSVLTSTSETSRLDEASLGFIRQIGGSASEVLQMITDLSKLSAEDRAKFEQQLTEATIKELSRRQQAALDYQEGIRKADNERVENQFAIGQDLEKKEDSMFEKAKQRATEQMREIEQTAQSIASTVVGLGRQLISDLMNDELTATEVMHNLFNSILELTATTLAEFMLAEGIKATMIAATSSAQQNAAILEISQSGMVTKVVLANEALKQKAKLATGAAGAASGAAGMAGGAAGLAGGLSGAAGGAASTGTPWGLIIAGILMVVSLVGSLMTAFNESKEPREATALEAAYMRETRFYSKGGLVTGGTPGQDSVSAMLTPGEFVLNKGTVDAIRKGAPPKTPGRYASGGMVMAAPAGRAQVIFAPQINTLALPDSIQNMRYYRDTVAKTQGRMASLKSG